MRYNDHEDTSVERTQKGIIRHLIPCFHVCNVLKNEGDNQEKWPKEGKKKEKQQTVGRRTTKYDKSPNTGWDRIEKLL